jgi:nicotinate phosphoribosyltransferase
VGTVPHGLIAAYGGDTVKAAVKFAERYHEEMNITVLVDFENDSVKTALDVASALGPRLWGVRLDTSEQLVDRSLWEEMGGFKPTGVNPRLVEKVRGALDGAGFPGVRIVVSGGFNAARIREFEAKGVAVDAYGVGSSLLRGENDFTADVVLLEGRPCAKVGRGYAPNPRLSRVQ